MVTLYQSLLGKLTGWKRGLLARDGHGQLPEVVQTYLAKHFKLLPEDMVDLRYFRGSSGFVRVYDAAKAGAQGVIIKNYHDLDKHGELVRFYGHFYDRNKSLHLKKAA